MEILLVDDHALTRDGLAFVLEKLEGNIEIFQAEDAPSAIAAAANHPNLDLVMLDYNIPGNADYQTLGKIKDLVPATPVVIISAEDDAELIQEGLRIGASGFLTKNLNSEVILNAIKLVLSGGLYIPPAILKKTSLLNKMPLATPELTEHQTSSNQSSQLHLEGFTDRQESVLHLMAQGFSNKEIAKHLNLSPSTVKVHVAAILRKCNAENRTQAVSIARQKNLISGEMEAGEE